ncbi:MAG: molybdopterin molybdotransferase MoeA [Alphaproteobacteria bacterium]|nr:molybdopterin molybdotransferase MoeA [Alphaproteobacteria bacterium]
MISVAEARDRIRSALMPVGVETVSLDQALGRVTATPLLARRTQPPKDVSAMDGYAVRGTDVQTIPVTLKVVAEVAAGGSYETDVPSGNCTRIFTGAPLPSGTDTIIIQEDTVADEAAGTVIIREGAKTGTYVRKAGLDFAKGDELIPAGHRLTARDIGTVAGMNIPWLSVYRKPRIAILSTGNEIAMPGDPLGPNQIVSSNGPALCAAVTAAGGVPTLLPIAADDPQALAELAHHASGHDMLLTTGGASVGKHDLVGSVLQDIGLKLDFWKIAMRPGKPLMFGILNNMPMIGLPGNPVSALVCFLLFGQSALARLGGMTDTDPVFETARLGTALGENDQREDYLRATLHRDSDGFLVAEPFVRQDSSMMRRLAAADCLIRRLPHAAPIKEGQPVEIMMFSGGYLSF